MNLKQIEIISEAKGINIRVLAEKANVAFSGLYRSIKENTIKASTLERIAEILEVPISVFFEDELGGTAPAVDVEKLREENDKLKNRIKELVEQLGDKRFIITKLKIEIEVLNEEKKEVISKLPLKDKMIYKVLEFWDSSIEQVYNEYPELDSNYFLSNNDEPFTNEQIEELRIKRQRVRDVIIEKMNNDPMIKNYLKEVGNTKEVRNLFLKI